MSLSGYTKEWFLASSHLTSVKSREAYFCHRPWSMAGHRRDRKISRRGFWNAGTRTGGKCLSMANGLSAQGLSPRQTTQHPPLKLSGSTPRCFVPAIDAVAEHFCHDTITAKKVHLKTMRLFSGTRFGVDAANVFFRIRIGPYSSLHGQLTRS